jgi:hypothetical protein
MKDSTPCGRFSPMYRTAGGSYSASRCAMNALTLSKNSGVTCARRAWSRPWGNDQSLVRQHQSLADREVRGAASGLRGRVPPLYALIRVSNRIRGAGDYPGGSVHTRSGKHPGTRTAPYRSRSRTDWLLTYQTWWRQPSIVSCPGSSWHGRGGMVPGLYALLRVSKQAWRPGAYWGGAVHTESATVLAPSRVAPCCSRSRPD